MEIPKDVDMPAPGTDPAATEKFDEVFPPDFDYAQGMEEVVQATVHRLARCNLQHRHMEFDDYKNPYRAVASMCAAAMQASPAYVVATGVPDQSAVSLTSLLTRLASAGVPTFWAGGDILDALERTGTQDLGNLTLPDFPFVVMLPKGWIEIDGQWAYAMAFAQIPSGTSSLPCPENVPAQLRPAPVESRGQIVASLMVCAPDDLSQDGTADSIFSHSVSNHSGEHRLADLVANDGYPFCCPGDPTVSRPMELDRDVSLKTFDLCLRVALLHASSPNLFADVGDPVRRKRKVGYGKKAHVQEPVWGRRQIGEKWQPIGTAGTAEQVTAARLAPSQQLRGHWWSGNWGADANKLDWTPPFRAGIIPTEES